MRHQRGELSPETGPVLNFEAQSMNLYILPISLKDLKYINIKSMNKVYVNKSIDFDKLCTKVTHALLTTDSNISIQYIVLR